MVLTADVTMTMMIKMRTDTVDGRFHLTPPQNFFNDLGGGALIVEGFVFLLFLAGPSCCPAAVKVFIEMFLCFLVCFEKRRCRVTMETN